MNIALIAHFAGSPHHGMVYGHYFLAKEWIKLGHDITIIASGYVHTRHSNPELDNHLITEEYIDGIRYLWIKTPKYNPASNIGRALNILCFSTLTRYVKLPLDHIDLVVSSSHHTLSIFAALKLAQQFSAKLVYEVRDLWPMGLIELGEISIHNPFIKLLQYGEDLSYKNADKVISLMPYAKEYMMQRGMAEEKFTYIPNGFDDTGEPAHDSPLPQFHQAALDKFKRNNHFVVIYAGNFGNANEISTLIESLTLCQNQKVAVILVGKGPYLLALNKLVCNKHLEHRVSILPPLSKALVLDLIKQADLGFIGLKDQTMFRFGISPTKINDYFKARIPILYAINYRDEAIESSGVIFQCQSGSPDSVAKKIDLISSLPTAERKEIGDKGYQWALLNRGYSQLAARFIDVLKG